jgi:PleD family two-component response regulator
MANRDKAPSLPLVLIANDQEWSARSLESILGPNGFSVVRAYTGQQALERARTSQPDLIILDAQMPDMHGFEVCRTLRSDPRFSATTPIVITTSGPSGRTQRLEAYRAGAWEFLGQPLDGEALLLKLNTFLQSKREVDSLREENLLDPGSGLYNMRGLSRRAREIGAEAFRRRDPIACVVFAPDVDEEVEAEDDEGRRMSDQVALLFRQAGRASDAIGRLGPAEYGVIAPATGPEARRRDRIVAHPRSRRREDAEAARRLLRRSRLRGVLSGCRGAAAARHDGPAGPQAGGAKGGADPFFRAGSHQLRQLDP